MNTEYTSKTLFKRKNVEYEVWGDEPEWPTDLNDTTDIRLGKIYSWYNYYFDKEDGKKWIIKWMSASNYTVEEINEFERSIFPDCSLRWPIIARMVNRGFKVSDILIDKLKDFISNCQTNKNLEKKKDIPVIQNRTQEKIKDAIGEIEAEIDIFLKDYKVNKNNTPIYEKLLGMGIKAPQAKQIKDYYLPLQEELSLIDKDPQLKEAHKDLSAEQKKNYQKYIDNLISDVDRFMLNENIVKEKKPRKARKKKTVDLSQVVKNVKYKIQDKDLQLVSIAPMKIIGANQVWLYNTKYKMLRKLETSNPEGFTIKGTTIFGFDEKLSRAKSLRKPKEILSHVLTATKYELKKIFDKLTTVDSAINGRISEETIILRINK